MADEDDEVPDRMSSRRIGMADIARIARVSKPTVSRVLNDSALVKAETRARVLEVAQRYGYQINRTAQRLRQTRSRTIGVVLDFGSYRGGRIADPFVFDLLAGVSEAVTMQGLDLMLTPPSKRETAAYYRDMVSSRMVDGFVFLGQGNRAPILRELGELGIPFVLWGAVEPEEPYCAVGSDNVLGGRLAATHFLRSGRSRWLFVGDVAQPEVRLRYEGMLATSRQAGTAPPAIAILPTTELSYTSIFRDTAKFLTGPALPDAVFAYSDTAAMAVLAAFRQHGLEAPRDFALVGYNNIPPAAHYRPAITTVEQQTQIAGALLVEKLGQAIEGQRPSSAMLPTRLILRET